MYILLENFGNGKKFVQLKSDVRFIIKVTEGRKTQRFYFNPEPVYDKGNIY